MRGLVRAVLMGWLLLGQWLVATVAWAALTISPSPSTDGSYTVSWTEPAVSSIDTKLYEKVGSWQLLAGGHVRVDDDLEGIQRQGGGHVQLQDGAVRDIFWQHDLLGFRGPDERDGECRDDSGADRVHELGPLDGGSPGSPQR